MAGEQGVNWNAWTRDLRGEVPPHVWEAVRGGLERAEKVQDVQVEMSIDVPLLTGAARGEFLWRRTGCAGC